MTEQMTTRGKWLIADAGMYLWYLYGLEYYKRVLLGKNRTASMYEEVTEEELNRRLDELGLLEEE